MRTLADSFASGVFFVLALKSDSESTAALVSSFSLFLSFSITPIAGYYLDHKNLQPRKTAFLFIFSSLGMILFLFRPFTVTFAIFINIFVMNLLGIPALLYMNYISSIMIENRPASGFSLFAAINSSASIIGSILGAYFLKDTNLLSSWVVLKIIITILTGLILVIIFTKINAQITNLEDLEPERSTKLNGSSYLTPKTVIQQLMLLGREIYQDVRNLYTSKEKSLLNSRSHIFILGLIMCFFAANRIFFLLLIAFRIFIIFDSNVFLYTVFANTASLLAVITFPFYGKIADRIGGFSFLMIGIIIQPVYFILFLMSPSDIILVILWALPLSSILDVSLTGLVSQTTRTYERSGALGFISGMNALGYMIGSLIVSQFVLTSQESWILYIPIISAILCAVLIIPLNPDHLFERKP